MSQAKTGKTKKPAAKKPATKTKRKPKQQSYVGRPIKLTEAKLKAAQRYYKECLDSKETPFVEELAIYYLDVDRGTIDNWVSYANDEAHMAKQTPLNRRLLLQFFLTIKKLSTMQLFRLKKDGLGDKRNAVAIFLMKANHGMVETTRHEVTGKDGQPIQFKPIQVMNIKGRMEPDDDE